MTLLRSSANYQPLPPLRLESLNRGRIVGSPPAGSFMRAAFMAAALALPVLGTWIASIPQRLPVPGGMQIAAILGPAPSGVAAVRIR